MLFTIIICLCCYHCFICSTRQFQQYLLNDTLSVSTLSNLLQDVQKGKGDHSIYCFETRYTSAVGFKSLNSYVGTFHYQKCIICEDYEIRSDWNGIELTHASYSMYFHGIRILLFCLFH